MAKDKEEKKGKRVEVDADALKKILEQNEELLGRVNRLESTADIGRLDNFDNKNRKIGPARYRLSVYEGKVITGWLTKKDSKWMDGNVMRVDQRYEILLSDGKKIEVNGYDNFASILYAGVRVIAEKVKENTDEFGITLTLKVVGFPDGNNVPQGPEAEKATELFGKEVVIDSRFVN